jgi:hypothetical protein
MDDDDELIGEIAPDVIKVLVSQRFFEALDDQMCPADLAQPRLRCAGTYAIATAILTKGGFDPLAIGEITQVFASVGACCDCEILFNVAEESRLRSEYWKARSDLNAPPESRARHLDA